MSNAILDIETASRLKGFYFRTRHSVRGQKSGIHKSLYRGISPDFMEYKEYNPGDELKQVDWRLYGRHDRLYVKKYEDEVNLSWCVLLDKSASMDYGEDDTNKLKYSKRIAATLSYLLLRQGDSVGLGCYSETSSELIPPRSGNSAIMPIVEKLEGSAPEGVTVLKDPVIKALELFRSSATFVIISDFLMETKEIRESLQLARASKKDIILFHVLHPDETDFGFEGSIEFQDMESQDKVIVDTGSIRHTYTKRVGEFLDELRSMCHEYECRYVLCRTDVPIEEPLIEIADK